MHQHALQSRLNKTIGRKNQLSGSFAYQSTRTDSPNVFGFLDTGDAAGINAALNWRDTVRPRLFRDLGYQINPVSPRATPDFSYPGKVSAPARIPGHKQEPGNRGPPPIH